MPLINLFKYCLHLYLSCASLDMVLNVSLGQNFAAEWTGVLVLPEMLLLDMSPAVGLVSEFLPTSFANIASHSSLNIINYTCNYKLVKHAAHLS